MAHAYVHIGTEKTGTTYIQDFLKTNAELIALNGAHFPTYFMFRRNLRLVVPFARERDDIDFKPGDKSPTDIDAVLLDLDERLSGAQGTWIFSAEHLSSRLDTPEEVGAFLAWLDGYFDTVTVVLFLRRQDFMIPSSYSTRVMGGGSEPLGTGDTHSTLFDLESVVDSWAAHLEPENFIVRPYFEGTTGTTLIHEFFATVNLPVDAPWENPPSRSNKRLSGDALEVLRLINRQLEPQPNRKHQNGWKRLRDYLQQLPGEPWQLPGG
ncbi:MAG: hypothetical protein HQ526_10610, partial [Actinobacteria bacterium]|nr:hypothetical protein [Actinomycetota bacterium]